MTYTKPVAIFCIDHEDDFTTLKKFMMYLDNLWVLGHLNYKPRQCTGMWNNLLENSFVMDLDDFNEYAKSWCTDQDAILEVHPKSYRQPHIKIAFMKTIDKGFSRDVETKMIGEFVRIDPWEASGVNGWTYFMDTKEYWTCG
jgi:hypothetical protein